MVNGAEVGGAGDGDASALQARTTAMQRLSILLASYNAKKYLSACMESIDRFAPPGTETILENNGSTDGSMEEVAEKFPWVHIVHSARNLGFAAGTNLAARKATGHFFLLLNTDAELLEPIAPVIAWMENHPDCGVLSIKMLDGNRVNTACTGRFPTPIRLALLRKMLIEPQSDARESYDVDWVQGSFLLIRAELWRALNGMDERYFMYGDDVDLCKRVWDAGFRCVYLTRWQYLHWGGFAVKKFPDQVRAMATWVDLYTNGPQKFLCRLALLGGCLLRAVIFRVISMQGGEKNRVRAHASWDALMGLVHR
jgi:GT2 family glycosyltransferase